MKNQIFLSVNFHLWEPCNMRCKFCFATFQDVKQSVLPNGHLPKFQAIEVVKSLADFGFQKITFAGGEPTLCPWISELIQNAKQKGMTTMIVTNGSRLSEEFLNQNQDNLDWIAISVDSLNPETNLAMGRAIAGRNPLTLDYYQSVITKIKSFGYGLKINTVVNHQNCKEDMSDFIKFAKPKRWKILQALPISGQNDSSIDEMKISDVEFENFIQKHQDMKNYTEIIAESNKQMTSSYLMVDPAGRFFDNSLGFHSYSDKILDVGVENALKQVSFDEIMFESRGGIYNWVRK